MANRGDDSNGRRLVQEMNSSSLATQGNEDTTSSDTTNAVIPTTEAAAAAAGMLSNTTTKTDIESCQFQESSSSCLQSCKSFSANSTPKSNKSEARKTTSKPDGGDNQDHKEKAGAEEKKVMDVLEAVNEVNNKHSNVEGGSPRSVRSSSEEELFSKDVFGPPEPRQPPAIPPRKGQIASPAGSSGSRGDIKATPPPAPFRRSTTTMSSVDSEMLEKQEMISCEDECDGFISQIDKDGNIQQVPVKYEGDKTVLPTSEEEHEEPPNSIGEFIGADILAKPFNFVSGNVTRKRYNPFRKKQSGLLNVLAKQATRNRIVAKNGNINTQSSNDGQSHKFFKDFFITLLDLHWGWIFILFGTTFFSSWLIFATAWYLTFLQHGDFEEENRRNDSFRACVSQIEDFTSCFLFSIETQHTIGYGGRATTEQCPFAIIIMCLQSIVGVIIQACMAGIIFAKFTVPRHRGQTIIFSKNAVITMRNGCLYILCRISDLRKYSLLEAHVRMIVVQKEKTEEGEVIPYQQTDLECGSEIDGTNDRVLIMWPVTISHKIDEDSPFFEMSPQDFLNNQYEIVVVLEGITEETGNTVQARTSYLPNEILWGHHFENAGVAYDKKAALYMVQHGIINKTVVDLTPRCSAKQLQMRREKRTSSAMTNSSSEEISPKTTFKSNQPQTNQ